ncbi:hypothetical protein P8452_64863 [Trifolium repens]|nr:hypothetical protein P8452_64863 [Trifolium repens]
MFSRERSCDFSLTLSQPLLRLGFVGDLAPGTPGFLQVHPGFFSKFSWLLTSNRILSPCLSSPQIRSHRHWFASHFLSTPPLVIGQSCSYGGLHHGLLVPDRVLQHTTKVRLSNLW